MHIQEPGDGELGKGKRKKKATWKLQDPNWESKLPELPARTTPKKTPEKKKQQEKHEGVEGHPCSLKLEHLVF